MARFAGLLLLVKVRSYDIFAREKRKTCQKGVEVFFINETGIFPSYLFGCVSDTPFFSLLQICQRTKKRDT